jgi:hypothetical protein
LKTPLKTLPTNGTTIGAATTETAPNAKEAPLTDKPVPGNFIDYLLSVMDFVRVNQLEKC